MRLDIYLDLGNVSGLFALASTRQLIEDTGVEARWLPIKGIVPRPLPREVKPESTQANLGNASDDPLAEYKQLRWQARYDSELAELQRNCARHELSLDLARQSYDGHLTHLVWLELLAAKKSPLDFIGAVYEQRFRQGRSLESLDEVLGVAAQFGLSLDRVAIQREALNQAWSEHEARYLALGVHDSPAYVLGEETFQGRQHMPLIRWRIAGEQGPPPV